MNLKRDFLSVLSDSTLTFVERSVKLYPFLVFLSRAIRSDKLDDYIKLKQKGIVIAGHQLHFFYVRTVDVQLYIRQAYQCHFCEAIVLLHKPYYVRRGQRKRQISADIRHEQFEIVGKACSRCCCLTSGASSSNFLDVRESDAAQGVIDHSRKIPTLETS